MVKQDARPRSQESVGTRYTRRTVAQGLAWSVPVVAVASAAPAFATSCQLFTLSPDSCKCPGKATADPFGYYLSICYTCPPPSGGDITINSVSKANGDVLMQKRRTGACGPLLPTTLKAGECTQALFFEGTNSGNFLIINFTLNGVDDTFKIAAPPDCAKTKCQTADAGCPTLTP